MAIYSYYYGASAKSGIGIQAMSRQLENHAVRSDLKDLAALHALGAAEHEGGMLSYLLRRDGFGILGLSYIESPKNSGYNRSAPCSLQYVIPEREMDDAGGDLGGIVNFISFQKPATDSPAPLDGFPLNESGYYYHNSPAVLASLVDGLVQAALSDGQEVLLVALPKGKTNEYTTARYTIAEALNYLPVPLRSGIRFFTGLPVGEGVTDAEAGYDNALKYNANVIFCAKEHFEKLKSYRSFIGVDMDQPGGRVGAFAEFISRTLTPSGELSRIAGCLSGPLTYSSLNQAALKVKRGELVTMDKLRSALDRSEQMRKQCEQQIYTQDQELTRLRKACDELREQQRQQQEQQQRQPIPQRPQQLQLPPQRPQRQPLPVQQQQRQQQQRQPLPPQQQRRFNHAVEEEPDESRGEGILQKLLPGLCVFLLMAVSGFAGWMGATYVHTGEFFPKKETPAVITEVPAEIGNTDEQTSESAEEPTSGNAAEETPESADEPTSENAEALTSENTVEETPENTEEPAPENTDIPIWGSTDETAETVSPAETPEPAAAGTDPKGQSEQAAPGKDASSDGQEQEKSGETKTEETDGKRNRYAFTNGAHVNFREGNSTSKKAIKGLHKNTKVWIVKTELNDSGEEWSEVCVDGQHGYIMTKYLTILSPEESAAYDAEQPSPVPEEMYDNISE